MGAFPHFPKMYFLHFLQIHKPLDSIISKCSEISIDPLPMKSLWSFLIWPEVSYKNPTHVFRALLFPALLCCLLWLLSTIVDEVDEILEDGPEGLKTLMNKASNPLTMSMEHFLCISHSTILLLQRNHDEVVSTLMVATVTSSLILALCMTLPSYEGYAGGSR